MEGLPSSMGLGPKPGPGPRAALGPVPGPVRARSQAGAGSPGLGPRLQGPGPAHVSALLAIYVSFSKLIYINLRYVVPKTNKLFQIRCPEERV